MTSKQGALAAAAVALSYDIFLSVYALLQLEAPPRMFEFGVYLVYMAGGFVTWRVGGYKTALLAGFSSGLAVATLGAVFALALKVLPEYQPITVLSEPIVASAFSFLGGSIQHVATKRWRNIA